MQIGLCIHLYTYICLSKFMCMHKYTCKNFMESHYKDGEEFIKKIDDGKKVYKYMRRHYISTSLANVSRTVGILFYLVYHCQNFSKMLCTSTVKHQYR